MQKKTKLYPLFSQKVPEDIFESTQTSNELKLESKTKTEAKDKKDNDPAEKDTKFKISPNIGPKIRNITESLLIKQAESKGDCRRKEEPGEGGPETLEPTTGAYSSERCDVTLPGQKQEE